MIEIEYKPITKIIIHDFQWSSLDTLIQKNFSPTGNFGWCDGTVFAIFHPHQTDELTMELIRDGINHFQDIELADMPTFKPYVSNPENFKMPVIDQSDNKTMQEIVKFLKSKRPSHE